MHRFGTLKTTSINQNTVIAYSMLAFFAMLLLLFPVWTVDDAYISLRYAENLVRHGELTWNVGDAPIEGYTGILWVLLAAGAIWLNLPPLLVWDLVGITSAILVLVLVETILNTLGCSERQRTLARLLIVANGAWAMHAGSGLETMLFTALLLGCLLASLKRSRLLPLLCWFTALTRPEGAALAVALALHDWMTTRETTPILTWVSRWAIGFIVPGVIYFLWRMDYYGQLLPNTFYVKSGSGESSWPHLLNFGLVSLLFPVLAWRNSRPQFAALEQHRPLVIAWGSFVVGLLLLYGQSELLMNYGNRFFMPLFPIVLIWLIATWGPRPLLRREIVGYILINFVYFVGAASNAYHYERMEKLEHAAAAAWISEQSNPDDTLMVIVDAGLVPLQTKLHTIDAGALNDPFLAHERDAQRRADYLFAQEPEFILLAVGDLGIVAANATRDSMLNDPRWSNYCMAQDFRRIESRWEYNQQIWVPYGRGLCRDNTRDH